MNGERAKDSTVSQEALEKLFAGMGLAALLKKSSEDESFKRVVIEFQKKAVEHAKVSGTIMDIIGKDNIVFIKKEDGNWDYKLADAIFPLESNVLEKAKEIISRVRPGQKLPFNERLIVRWAVGHVRQINALGKMLGTDAYIDLSEDKIPGTEITIAELVTARNEKSKVQETSDATGPVKKPGSLFRRVNGK